MRSKLETYRREIDTIDGELLTLLAKRMELVTAVGMWKQKYNRKPLDKKRWEEVLVTRIEKGEKLGLKRRFTQSLYILIHKYALEIEKKI